MQPQTQSQNLKVCNSCKRTLHVSCFGITRKSKDGFNACCKECRNYRRRKHYHQSTSHEPFILPLDENNQTVLKDALAQSNKIAVPCLNMSTSDNLTFIVENLGEAYRFEVSNGKSDSKDIFYTGYTDLFVTTAVNLLRQRNLRLFPIEEPHQILEWQYGLMKSTYAHSGL